MTSRDHVVRTPFAVLSHALRAFAARWAERLFFAPPRSWPSAAVRELTFPGHRSSFTREGGFPNETPDEAQAGEAGSRAELASLERYLFNREARWSELSAPRLDSWRI